MPKGVYKRSPSDNTECPHGHPWTEENTGISARGYRFCRECNRIHSRRGNARRYAANPEKYKAQSRDQAQNHHPLYSTWQNMRQRCVNPKHPAYSHYGERGVTVCERWSNSFKAFLEDMGEKPSPELSIDRIDNDGNYEPGNCRWATKSQQMLNRRSIVKQRHHIHHVTGRQARAVKFLDNWSAKGVDFITLLLEVGPVDKLIIEKRMQGYTQTEIGKMLGLSHTTVGDRENKQLRLQ